MFSDAELKEFHRLAKQGAQVGSPRWAQYQLILALEQKIMATIQQYDTDVQALVAEVKLLITAYQALSGTALPQSQIDSTDSSVTGVTQQIQSLLAPPASTVTGSAGTDTTAGAGSS